jgi:hypothetical protein
MKRKHGIGERSGTLSAASDGPVPRTITFFGAVPVMINPPIIAFSPVPTCSRVLMLIARPGVATGLGDGEALGEGEALGLAVGDGVGDGVGVGSGTSFTVIDTVAAAESACPSFALKVKLSGPL